MLLNTQREASKKQAPVTPVVSSSLASSLARLLAQLIANSFAVNRAGEQPNQAAQAAATAPLHRLRVLLKFFNEKKYKYSEKASIYN